MNDLESKNQEIYFEDAQCVRKRTQKGGVYGAMDPVVMTFSVRVNDQLHALRFFKAIASNQMTVMSFLFNAAYDERQRLKDFEDGMVVRGFVDDAEQSDDLTILGIQYKKNCT